MKTLCSLLACLCFAVALRAAPPEPDAGGVTLEVPEGGKVAAGTALSVSFPTEMVAADKIDLGGEASPVRFAPPLPGTWLWKSQTDGEFTVKGPVTPGQTYAASLAPGLRDAAGAAVAPPGWGAELRAEAFKVACDWEVAEHLSSKPGVVLKFNYPVRLGDVAERIYFQAHKNGARRPAELALREEDREEEQPEAAVLRATPREPLPAGERWDLIVEDAREQDSGQPLPYLKAIALGTTAPLTLKWLGAFNLPLEKPLVRARFDDYLDPASVNASAVQVEPPVPNIKVRTDGEDVVIEGDFDRAKHYQVTVSPAVAGRRGYGLEKPARWGATFRPKASALFFPGEQVSERAALGLRFSFLQVHTGALRWRLAAVPLEKLAAVRARLREFTAPKRNPFSGQPETDGADEDIPQPTELLVNAFGLETHAEGAFPASAGEAEDLRELRWMPPGGGGVPPGAYLLEVSGPRWDNQGLVGHRSLVVFSESVITEKRTPDAVLARVAGMADGLPRAGVTVRAVSASNFEVARAVTDRTGVAQFTAADLTPPKGVRGGESARSLVADAPEGPAIAALDSSGLDDTPTPEPPDPPLTGQRLRAAILTDRSLYRPGQTARIKGLVRLVNADGSEGGRLHVPAGQSVAWSVAGAERDEPVARGDATVDAEGGWEARWAIPTGTKLGDYRVSAALGGVKPPKKHGGDDAESAAEDAGSDSSIYLHIQDYKVPLFEVAATAEPIVPAGSVGSDCRVRAGYFSGQPVAGARVAWRVHWERRDYLTHRSDDEGADTDAPEDRPGFQLDDTYSERAAAAPPGDPSPPESKGEARLDAKGEASLHADPPPNLPGARYDARWEVAVTSADGQSVAAGGAPTQAVLRQPVLLGVAADTAERGQADAPPPQTVRVHLGAFDAADAPASARDVRVELFRVGTKTVRENVAPFVVRYRNTPRFTSVKAATVARVGADSSLDVPVAEPGRYVAVATAPGLRPVSAEILVDGPGEDEVPVETETSLSIRAEKKEYAPGETAVFLTRAPVTGVAWVSIETDRVLDTVLVPLPGNTSRAEFPVKPEYAPNATVAVYLLRPGGGDRLPAERFGHAALRVRRPDRLLEVRPALDFARVRPGEEVRGTVRVASAGQPVAGADVTLWAVDDAILALGEWKMPDLAGLFYPDRQHHVKTYAALREYVLDVARKSLYQKGFVVGGGGEEFGNKFVRKDFQPLATWQTGLKTDAQGRVAVRFAAPDNLTRYRVVAVAQTRAGQFGHGEGTVEVAKPLIVEPSLPRFLRAGDEVELRAVVRQSVRESASVSAACAGDAGLTLESTGQSAAPITVARDQPAVFRFRAKVPDGPVSAKIAFRAGTVPGDPETADAVEVTLPILPPTILRHESTAGALPPGGDVKALLPEDARRPGAAGRYDVAVSTRADLPRLRALPAVLQYPHGCFEQITSRVLAYCGVRELLNEVPADTEGVARYRRDVEGALDRCARSVLPDGTLPYWSSKTTGNPFVTVQATWAARLAGGAGFEVDPEMSGKLAEAVKKITADEATPPTVRAFALMVQATRAAKLADADAESEATDGEIDPDTAHTLFLHRETLGDEGRALLAVALHRAGIMPEEARQLIREILPVASGAKPVPDRAFDPATFGSVRRVAAVAAWACAEVRPPEWKPADAAKANALVSALLDRVALNSTQENLWALFAFRALRKTENSYKFSANGIQPAPTRVSPDKTALEWTGFPLGKDDALFQVPMALKVISSASLYGVLTAEYRVGQAEEDARRDRGGLRVERVVRNLTDPARTGRPGEAPVRLNDRLLVTYRLQTPKLRAYVALEDELPAGLETLNPELPLFAPFYDLPAPAPGERPADLSSSELHDNVTRLYFDRLDPGVSTASVLMRATAAGTFRWPATQAGPMYEPAVGGLSPSGQIIVAGE